MEEETQKQMSDDHGDHDDIGGEEGTYNFTKHVMRLQVAVTRIVHDQSSVTSIIDTRVWRLTIASTGRVR